MIFDRTQNDVDTAILLRNTKVKKFETLTESEIATLEKGTLTINTLNRIEAKQEELKNRTYTYRGIANREFSLSLPIHSNLELEECSYRNGMLLIEFKNKAKKETMKSIEIKD